MTEGRRRHHELRVFFSSASHMWLRHSWPVGRFTPSLLTTSGDVGTVRLVTSRAAAGALLLVDSQRGCPQKSRAGFTAQENCSFH